MLLHNSLINIPPFTLCQALCKSFKCNYPSLNNPTENTIIMPITQIKNTDTILNNLHSLLY